MNTGSFTPKNQEKLSKGWGPLLSKFTRASFDTGYEPLEYNEQAQKRFVTYLENYDIDKDSTLQCYPDSFALGVLAKFIQRCDENQIALVCFNSPEYIVNSNFHTEHEEYLKQHNIKFLNYAHIREVDSSFYDISIWRDNAHLNIIGAEIFTEALIQNIEKCDVGIRIIEEHLN